MNKPSIFPKSLKIEGSNFKMCKLSKFLFSVIGYICKSSENLSFTVNRFQQAEITLIFVPTSIFAFSLPLLLSDLNIASYYFRCNIFAIKPSTRGIVEIN